MLRSASIIHLDHLATTFDEKGKSKNSRLESWKKKMAILFLFLICCFIVCLYISCSVAISMFLCMHHLLFQSESSQSFAVSIKI